MRFAGPDEVLACRVMTRSFPSDGGMIELSRQFLMANPTPCSRLICTPSFPKKSEVFSLTERESGSRVSWRATISICGLCSSWSLTTVFWASLMTWISVKPGAIVLTFQVPNLRVEFFCSVSRCAAYDPLFGFSLKLHAPSGASEPWRGSTLLAMGCPAWGER